VVVSRLFITKSEVDNVLGVESLVIWTTPNLLVVEFFFVVVAAATGVVKETVLVLFIGVEIVVVVSDVLTVVKIELDDPKFVVVLKLD
jgi:hypothetical protein